jgi:IMP dehydrogenase
MFEKAYTFDDVALVPQYNNIKSRTEPSLETYFTKNIKIKIPFIPANMDTVICENLADIIIGEGGIPIFHRFMSIEEQERLCLKYKDKCFVSCGLNDIDKLEKLFNVGALGVCIDVAHGHCENIINLIKNIKQNYPEKEVIAGNVCTVEGYTDLVNAGADAVKVGIGPGAACTTRIVTGFGVPQFTAIYNIAKVAKKLQVPIIADGGIRNSRDVVLALAAGASTVMIGNLFSKCYESAGEKYIKDEVYGYNPVKITNCILEEYSDKIYTNYRGQASKHFQEDYYGKMKEGTVAEGINFYTKCTGSAKDLINNLSGGLKSGLTYGGARNIKELQRKAEFVSVTHNYINESFPRISQ